LIKKGNTSVEHHIEQAVEEGMQYLSDKADVQEAEVFASVNAVLTSRINYTSHLPCNGLEEPKSTQTQGVGLRVVFKETDGVSPHTEKLKRVQCTIRIFTDSLHHQKMKECFGTITTKRF
jgi:hypothetical protein